MNLFASTRKRLALALQFHDHRSISLIGPRGKTHMAISNNQQVFLTAPVLRGFISIKKVRTCNHQL